MWSLMKGISFLVNSCEMCSNASYMACRQTDCCDDRQTMASDRKDCAERTERTAPQQSLISPSSTIPEQLECHIPAIPSPRIYQRCATRSRIAVVLICAVLLTFVIFSITAARAKSGLKYPAIGLAHADGQQWIAEQQALGLSQESVIVDTQCGKLIGDHEHQAFVFKVCPLSACLWCPFRGHSLPINWWLWPRLWSHQWFIAGIHFIAHTK